MRKTLFAAAAILSLGTSATRYAPYCAESVSIVLLNEETELGFSARDLLQKAEGNHQLDWTWDYKEETTKLNLRVHTVAREARYIDKVAVYPEGSPDIGVVCADRLEIDVWIDFFTIDGAFAERWYTTLYDTDGSDCFNAAQGGCAAPGALAKFYYRFDRDNLNGSFYGDVPIPEDVTIDFYAQGIFSADVIKVTVAGSAFKCDEVLCYADFIEGGHTL